MDIEQIERQLENLLSPERLKHCIGVSTEAARLALHYGVDVKKAELAGLTHDCVKEFDYEVMLKMCENYGLILDEVTKNEKKLIHAQLGAVYAKVELGIDDEEVFDAIKYHTTAKANMPLLTKIIYVADYIEPSRTFEGVGELRTLAYIDLDTATLAGLDYTINKLVGSGRMLHPETINARNFIIQKGVTVCH